MCTCSRALHYVQWVKDLLTIGQVFFSTSVREEAEEVEVYDYRISYIKFPQKYIY